MNQSEHETNTCDRCQARENTCEKVTFGLGFVFHWLRKRREFFLPIAERSKAKPKQTKNYFLHSTEHYSIPSVIWGVFPSSRECNLF